MLGGFNRYVTERYTERKNHYYQVFKAADPLVPKPLPPTLTLNSKNPPVDGLSKPEARFFDELEKQAEQGATQPPLS